MGDGSGRLGLLIPFWLVVTYRHRGAHQLVGVDDSYAYVLNALWPNGAWRQSQAIWLAARLHRIHFWLRLQPWYRNAAGLRLACFCRPWL